ncbi:leucine-specific-binding protein precursor [Peptococcaceae bacterium CEB3]|nr:leucine-specific-binding protein precursor [Peptococcaceae bacterium CEB3]
MKKIFGFLTVGILCLSLAGGCGTTGAAAGNAAGGTIKVGGDLELSGGQAMFGQEAQNGIKMAFDQINAKGGVLGGKKLTLDVADNKSDPGEATIAATKLVGDNVVAVIGPMTSSLVAAATPVVTDSKVPLITPSGTNAKLTMAAGGKVQPYIFRPCFIDPFQGQVGAKFAFDTLHAKTAAVIIDQKSDYAKGLADTFIANFTAAGGKIVDQEKYASGDKDFTTILTRIKGTNPDLIWLPGYYNDDGLIVKQARDLGMKMPFAGGDGWDDPSLFKIGTPEALNDTYYVDHVANDSPDMVQFVKDYKEKYGHEPNAMSALSYDSANMIINAIQTANSGDPAKITAELDKLTGFKGVTGEITIDPKTHNPQKKAVIKENKNGKGIYLTSVSPS